MPTLDETISRIRQKLRECDSLNEATTKTAFIQPIIDALGWDLTDPSEVTLEFKLSAGHNPVDFALLLHGKPVLFIEAKAWGTPLDGAKIAQQITSYAVQAGVQWIVITDGNEYRVYNTHAAVPLEEKLLRTARITDEDQGIQTLLGYLSKQSIADNGLSTLWAADDSSRRVLDALRSMFSSPPNGDLVELIAKESGVPRDGVRGALEGLDAHFSSTPKRRQERTNSAAVSPSQDARSVPLSALVNDCIPLVVCIPGFSDIPVERGSGTPFGQMFVQIGEVLDRDGRLPSGELRPNPRNAPLVTNEPKSGATRPLPSGRHINIRHTEHQFIACARELLKVAGIDPQTVRVVTGALSR